MGADSFVADGEQYPVSKHKGRPPYYGGRNNTNINNNTNYNSRDKFLGADPNLCGKVFEAKHNQSEQVVNLKTVNDLIKAQVGRD